MRVGVRIDKRIMGNGQNSPGARLHDNCKGGESRISIYCFLQGFFGYILDVAVNSQNEVMAAVTCRLFGLGAEAVAQRVFENCKIYV